MKKLIEHSVFLDPLENTYFGEGGRKYDRVSWVLDSVKNDFNKNIISWSMAKSQMRLECNENDEEITIRQESILKGWEEKNKRSTDFGSFVDGVIEQYLLDGSKAVGYEKMLDRMQVEIFGTYKKGFCQQVLYLDEYNVAGCTDYLGYVGRSVVDMYDWKTSLSKGEIEFYSKRGKYLKKPVSHLSDCSYSRYALQLSSYAYMLKRQFNYKTRRINIVFIPEINPELYQVIPAPFMLYEAKMIMKSYGKSKELFLSDNNLQTL